MSRSISAKLIREVVEDWVMAALEKRIDLGFEADGPAMVSGNTFLLRELAKNLIDNALRYTPAAATSPAASNRHGGQRCCLRLRTMGSASPKSRPSGLRAFLPG
jgi:signal transduction histidine kinase